MHKFVLIDCCNAFGSAEEETAAITVGRSDIVKMFERNSHSESWRLAYKLFRRFDWQPGDAMQLPHGAGWLFSVHAHVEL